MKLIHTHKIGRQLSTIHEQSLFVVVFIYYAFLRKDSSFKKKEKKKRLTVDCIKRETRKHLKNKNGDDNERIKIY